VILVNEYGGLYRAWTCLYMIRSALPQFLSLSVCGVVFFSLVAWTAQSLKTYRKISILSSGFLIPPGRWIYCLILHWHAEFQNHIVIRFGLLEEK
jgi:hypothetical protein